MNINKKIKVTIDSGANLSKIKKLAKRFEIELYIVNLENEPKVISNKIPTRWLLGTAKLPVILEDSNIFKDILTIIGNDGSNINDALILESHIIKHNDFFITNNPKDFIYNNKRKKLEGKFIGLKIVTVDEFEKILSKISPGL